MKATCLHLFNLSVPLWVETLLLLKLNILFKNLKVWLENKALLTRLKTGSFFSPLEKTHRPHMTAAPPTYDDLMHIAAKYKVAQISATTTLMLMQLQY